MLKVYFKQMQKSIIVSMLFSREIELYFPLASDFLDCIDGTEVEGR